MSRDPFSAMRNAMSKKAPPFAKGPKEGSKADVKADVKEVAAAKKKKK